MTTRGQVDWYGWQYMNRKFEQESTSWYSYQLSATETPKPPPMPQTRDRNAMQAWDDMLFDWIELVGESKWALKKDEAHSKYMTMYTNQLEEKAHMDHIQSTHHQGRLNNPKLAKRM